MPASRRRPSPRLPDRPRAGPLAARGLESVTYRDVDLLRMFVSDRGKIRGRRLTGLTPRQQRQVTRAVKTAREMALLPSVTRRP